MDVLLFTKEDGIQWTVQWVNAM